MTKEEYMKNLQDMVYDVNAAEIASHIENDSLRSWCHGWASEMLRRISQIYLVGGKDGKK